MASIHEFKGEHYLVTANSAQFFGTKGTRISPSRWTVNLLGGEAEIEDLPRSIISLVAMQLKKATDADRSPDNGQLRLSREAALIFFLEGGLPSALFDHATETDHYIELTNVRVDKYRLTVRIYDRPDISVVLTDEKGNMF
jgi:hypothetical protein